MLRFTSLLARQQPVLLGIGHGRCPEVSHQPGSGRGGRRRDEGVTDARGYIARVLMAWK